MKKKTKVAKTTITNTVEESQNYNGLVPLVFALGGAASMANYYEGRGQKELEEARELPVKINGGNIDYTEAYSKMGIKIKGSKPSDELFCFVILPKEWKIQRTDHNMWSNLLDDKGRKRADIFYKADCWDRDAFLNQNRRFNIDFHKHLSEDEKYLPEKTIMVEEPVEIETIYDDGYGDNRGLLHRIILKNDGHVRMVPKSIRERRFSNLYEEIAATPYWVEVKDHDGAVLFSTKKQYFRVEYPVLNKDGNTLSWSDEEHEKHRGWWRQHEEFEKLQRSLGILWLDQHYPNWNDPNAYWDI